MKKRRTQIIILIVLIIFIVFGLSVLCFSDCNFHSDLNSNADSASNSNFIFYEGVYYAENRWLGVRIDDDYFELVFADGSGIWGDYSIKNKTNSSVEIIFGNMYNVVRGTMTTQVAYRTYRGATVKKENGRIVMYLYYSFSTSGTGTLLVKE